MRERTILVIGGTGFLGSHIVRHLFDRGDRVVSFGRGGTGRNRFPDGVARVVGDVLDLRSVHKVTDDADAIIYAAGVTSVGAGRQFAPSHAVNVAGVRTVIDALDLRGRGLPLILLGTQANNSGTYSQTKREGEKLALKFCNTSLIVRPAFVYGPDPPSIFGRLAEVIHRLWIVPVVGRGDNLIRPVHVQDVAATVARCLDPIPSREVHVTGQEEVTLREFLELTATALGLRRAFVSLPYGAVFAGVRALELALPKPPITTDTLRGLRQGPGYAPGISAAELGVPMTPLQKGLRDTFMTWRPGQMMGTLPIANPHTR